MNIVTIIAYDRPESLFWCLEKIANADNSDQYTYLISLDHGYNPENIAVISEFQKLGFKCIIHEQKHSPDIHPQSKQSYNVLNAYNLACQYVEDDNGLIFNIEDDIIISKDFFTISEEIHALEPDIFSMIGSYNANSSSPKGSPDDYYVSIINTDFQSWGVSYKKRIISEYILPHVNMEYLKHPDNYVKKYFNGSKLGSRWTEQDGLIRRIQESYNMTSAFLCMQRAYHAGFYGYHRGKGPTGNLLERITKLNDIIFNQDEINKVQTMYKDSHVCDLNLSHSNLNKRRHEEAD